MKSQAQYRRGFESPVRQRISLPESTSSADSLSAVSVRPPVCSLSVRCPYGPRVQTLSVRCPYGPRVQTLSVRCPYGPRVQSHASTSVCTYKSQTLSAIPLFGHTKILHTLIGMGSAALAAAELYQVIKRSKFPARDNEVLRQIV